MRVFPFGGRVDGDTRRAHFLLSVAAPDRLHPHRKSLTAFFRPLFWKVFVTGEDGLREADFDGVAPLVVRVTGGQ